MGLRALLTLAMRYRRWMYDLNERQGFFCLGWQQRTWWMLVAVGCPRWLVRKRCRELKVLKWPGR